MSKFKNILNLSDAGGGVYYVRIDKDNEGWRGELETEIGVFSVLDVGLMDKDFINNTITVKVEAISTPQEQEKQKELAASIESSILEQLKEQGWDIHQ